MKENNRYYSCGISVELSILMRGIMRPLQDELIKVRMVR